MKNGGSAFPQIESEYANAAEHCGDTERPYSHVYSYGGMSLRDYFAGQALPAIITPGTMGMTVDLDAEMAYRFADAMLAEREKTK